MDELVRIWVIWIVVVIAGSLASLLWQGLKHNRWRLGAKEAIRSLLLFVYMASLTLVQAFVLSMYVVFADYARVHMPSYYTVITTMMAGGGVFITFLYVWSIGKWLPLWPQYSADEKAIKKQENLEFRLKHTRFGWLSRFNH